MQDTTAAATINITNNNNNKTNNNQIQHHWKKTLHAHFVIVKSLLKTGEMISTPINGHYGQ